ncbi:serine hydrolase [Streptomyces lucensis JCM 4490]|uniref:Serine hydrolase n=1 Tax=Streptomyces lucensis JCM 4490 TaxID=1306176 RepID=A0A918MU63_9ACTN|nr:serine hydrolase domain-containing protein [Streptomyces lucensis]GGW71782.1 serine hydrolase [Streptomyces lucensis JCM 4490]
MGQLRQEAEPAEAGLDVRALDRLDGHLARYVDEGRLPGCLVAVARGGRVAHLTVHGLRDVAAGLPVEPDTLWRIYSMTKPVTAVAVLMLTEEGRLSLDDPLDRFLPAFAGPRVYEGGAGADVRTRPASGPILIRHLLTHTAGLTFGFYHQHPVDALYRQAGLEYSVPPGAGLAETVETYARMPLQFDPGTRWNYSVASNVLGRVVEVVSGRPLDAFFAERILGPLGMSDTGFHVDPEQAHRLAELYGETEAGGIEPVPGLPVRGRPRFLSGSGGLVSSAHDFHRFMELLRRGGELDGTRLLSASAVALMTRNQLPGNAILRDFGAPVHQEPGNDGLGFGFNVSVVVDPSRTLAPSAPGTYGWTGAATTAFWVAPHHDLTVQFMSQVRPKTLKLFPELRRLVHEALLD